METVESELLKNAAREAAKASFSPYSHYPVGAAVMTEDGVIYSACNVESSVYGLSMCAERNALATAVSKGARKFRALAIWSENGATPCGACRQVIWELCGEIPIYIVDADGKEKCYISSVLLPDPFDENKLRK
ncbi:MAG: cytidine deaminase [Candidatus Marinimicrobia bacterium CG08_land_8_20_14_0_20_45_22]|nr:MAG: cytidine deaminase [Candidatus Marinimicrobia bacterium CG08_land_8_20_14_0_20_45_22]